MEVYDRYSDVLEEEWASGSSSNTTDDHLPPGVIGAIVCGSAVGFVVLAVVVVCAVRGSLRCEALRRVFGCGHDSVPETSPVVVNAPRNGVNPLPRGFDGGSVGDGSLQHSRTHIFSENEPFCGGSEHAQWVAYQDALSCVRCERLNEAALRFNTAHALPESDTFGTALAVSAAWELLGVTQHAAQRLLHAQQYRAAQVREGLPADWQDAVDVAYPKEKTALRSVYKKIA